MSIYSSLGQSTLGSFCVVVVSVADVSSISSIVIAVNGFADTVATSRCVDATSCGTTAAYF